MLYRSIVLLSIFANVLASSDLRHQPYDEVSRDTGSSDSNSLVVDLGYSIYQGVTSISTQLNVWLGIRYAASPEGNNRWQAPQVPTTDRSSVIAADAFGPKCPQSGNTHTVPLATGVTGSEDCLFLNVYSPINATNLPVLVWIHGGGYGSGDGRQDLSLIINENQNSFVGVALQYRLGAFGFLSSNDVFEKGVVNAGLLDQILGLQWIQAYIKDFGGDASRVTIMGESAGAGSVMLAGMAYGGTLGKSLFTNSITASPFLPMQHTYNDAFPTYQYDAFVEQVGCDSASSKFDCLVSAPSAILQNASSYISTSTLYGDWSFLPVTDGNLIRDLPSRQLGAKKVNGLRMLTGNNAIEGAAFTPQNITTEADLISWLQLTFPSFTASEIQSILNTYPSPDIGDDPNAPLFATDGIHPPTAINQSSLATGQQQRAINIYGETTFVCPSYWLATAYTPFSNNTSLNSTQGGYKYQYSVIPGTHGQDVTAYFDAPNTVHSADFGLAFKTIIGNFVTNNNPSISSSYANGAVSGDNSFNPISAWPKFENTNGVYPMINLNETFTATDVLNAVSLVDGWAWEGERGARCEFWRSIGQAVLEGQANGSNSNTSSDGNDGGSEGKSNNRRKRNIGIGVGVGIGVPLILLATVGLIFWHRRRTRTRSNKTMKEEPETKSPL